MKPEKPKTLEHVMGPLLESGVQECTRCGELLTDYRNAWVAPGSSPTINGLTPGQRYVKSDHPSGAGFGASRELTGALAELCQPILEHVAGVPYEMMQRCLGCGVVLLDWTKTSPPGNPWAPTGQRVVATATTLMPRMKWRGPVRPCKEPLHATDQVSADAALLGSAIPETDGCQNERQALARLTTGAQEVADAHVALDAAKVEREDEHEGHRVVLTLRQRIELLANRARSS